MANRLTDRQKKFLSTLPARGATEVGDVGFTLWDISIHAPREGSDRTRSWRTFTPSYFYPRSPRGERRNTLAFQTVNTSFLSTLPARGATFSSSMRASKTFNFYPRSPRGERLLVVL